MRIGQGIDVHAFSEDPDRPLVLAGVEVIPDGTWDMMYALACYGHLGLADKAKATLARFASQGRRPDFGLGAEREPYTDPAIRKLLIDGLKKASAL